MPGRLYRITQPLTGLNEQLYYITATCSRAKLMLVPMGRRSLLRSVGALAAGAAVSKFNVASTPPSHPQKPLKGLYPIGQDPVYPGRQNRL